MNLEDQLRQGLATLGETLRDTSAREIADATEALVAAAGAEQAAAVERAADDARAIAEAAAAEMLANAEQRALQQGREQGAAEGRLFGRDEGIEEGRKHGREEALAEAQEMISGARAEGRDTGLAEGREQGWNEGFEKGLEEGQEKGRRDGREEGRAEGRAEGLEEGRAEGIEQGRERARQEASAQRQADSLAAAASLPEGDTGARLIDGLRLIDDAGSLSSILDALTTSASRESPRVGVMLVVGDRLRGWRFVGFGAALDEAGGLELPVAESGVVGEAIRTRDMAFGNSADTRVPSFVTLPPGRQMLAVPVALSGEVVAVLYADQGSEQEGGNQRLLVHTLDALARHAARCLESTTAVRAAQLAIGGVQPGLGAPAAGHDEQESARRYARLLVSEIKMHNETAVLVGQSARDLTTRLGAEIARARALYEQGVPDHIRREGDYFDDELVRTLAGGDATLLGDRG